MLAARQFDLDPIFQLPYGPAYCTVALEAGQMTVLGLRVQNFLKNLLAFWGGVHR